MYMYVMCMYTHGHSRATVPLPGALELTGWGSAGDVLGGGPLPNGTLTATLGLRGRARVLDEERADPSPHTT